jgi:trehalose 6-phosphate synthase
VRSLRFLLGLMLGLGLLALGGDIVLSRTVRAWVEHDLELRSRLAVASAERSLAGAWADPQYVAGVLTDITRDERIMGALACTASGEMVASTGAYPREFPCAVVLGRMQSEGTLLDGSRVMTGELASGPVHLSAMPVGDLGSVILVHDVSFLARREVTTRNILLVAAIPLQELI